MSIIALYTVHALIGRDKKSTDEASITAHAINREAQELDKTEEKEWFERELKKYNNPLLVLEGEEFEY
jgi:hypothetical protein